MSKKNSNILNMFIVTFLTLIAKFFAIARQMVLTYCYGAGDISDAYLLAQSIPETLFLLISTAIGVSFIPVFTKVKEEKGNDETKKFTNNIITILIILSTILVLLTFLFSEQITFAFASGFTKKTLKLTASFLRISIFSIYFVGIIGVLSSYLKIKGDYFSPSIIGMALSVVEICTCLISVRVGNILLPIGIVLAAIMQWLILFFASWRKGYFYTPFLDIKSKYIKAVIMMSLPIMIGLGMDEINVIVDRTIASTFATGSISSLTYANTIVGIVHNIISVSINSVVFVEVTKYAAERNNTSVLEEIFHGLEKILIFLIPATIGLITFSKPIVRFLYERGSFNSDDTAITTYVMIFYAIYIIPNGVRLIVQSYFYAYGKTRFCMYAGIVAIFVNIFFNIVLSRKIGVEGLALATSIGIIVSTGILLVKFLRENNEFPIKEICILSIKLLGCSFIMIIPSFFVFKIINIKLSEIISLIIAVFVACCIYFIMLILLSIIKKEQIKIALKSLRRR